MLKRGQPEHEVPLPRQAVAVLMAQEQVGEFVFGRHGRGPFSGFSRAKAQLDVAIAKLRAMDAGHDPEKVDLKEWLPAAWSLHDLRTSMVTHSADKELAQPHVIEAAINHLGGHRAGVAGIYNQAAYRKPKRLALQAWADWLQAVVEGREPATNVVELRA
jgi:integrase